jgi:hypothetical protein
MKFLNTKHILLIGISILMTISSVKGQFQTNGGTTALGGSVYQLTTATAWQNGSVWNKVKHNLNNPFSVRGTFNFGANDATGADGICFVMQNKCVQTGGTGGGIGYQNMPGQSIAVEFDTWQNAETWEPWGEPVYDHVAVQKNGNVNHLSPTDAVTVPVQMSSTSDNVEDNLWHTFQINYDPATKLLTVYFDGALRINIIYDIPANVFTGNPWVFWGFTSSTGGSFNNQQVQINGPNPLKDTTICTGSIPIVLEPLSVVNLAQGKTATAIDNSGNAHNAVDGSMTSNWGSNSGDSHWLQVDLGDSYDIDSVTIDFGTTWGVNYNILTSLDGISWATSAAITGGDGGFDKIIMSVLGIRYVRFLETSRNNGSGVIIKEFRVYGPQTYLWSTNNGTESSISPTIKSASVSLTPTVTTIYTVRIPDACLGFTTQSMTVTISCAQPVSLVAFNAQMIKDVVSLTWVTASEENTNYFEIWSSSDGVNFHKVTSLPAANTSHNLLEYQYADDQPLYGISYYKLVAVDFDGAKQESELKTIKSNATPIIILNSVFENETTLVLPENTQRIEYEIIDMLGRNVLSVSEQNPSSTLLIGKSLAPAQYILKVKVDSDFSTIKINKVN